MSNLLIVDDDALARQILADLVAVHGHTVVACADAAAALEALAGPAGRFHAVITDVRMPEMDGIDLARQIQVRLPGLPVALTSAEPDFNIHEEAATRGLRATITLQKPFQARAVLRVLEQLLGRPSTSAAQAPARNPTLAPTGVPLGKDDAPVWLDQGPLPISKLAPIRLWFVASRRRASGHIVLDVPGGVVRVPLRSGQLVQGSGAAGSSPAALARWMLDLHDGSIHFQASPAAAMDGPVVASTSVPEAVSLALAAVPHAVVQHSWSAVLSARAFARSPRDSHPEAWGLDALGSLAHASAVGQRVEALTLELARESSAFRTSGFRTLEMLARLNLLTLLA